MATPGHTNGTLSYVFPVKDQGRTVMVAYSGGTLTGAFGTIAAPRQVGETHPFIVGTVGVQRYFTVMSECATASKLRAGTE